MTKSLFKVEYSTYRKNKRDAHSRGKFLLQVQLTVTSCLKMFT
jgi:hypothetical protein